MSEEAVEIGVLFAGHDTAKSVRFRPEDAQAFVSDWKQFLADGRPSGGIYACLDSRGVFQLGINFFHVAAVEFERHSYHSHR